MKIITPFILIFTLSSPALAENLHWNFRTSPVAWVIGPNLRLDLRLLPQWTLGFNGAYIDSKIKAVKLTGSSGSVLLNYNFNEAMHSGWFIDLGGGYGDIRAEAANAAGQLFNVRLHNLNGHLVGGYHWFWESFNLAIGAGADTNSAGNTDINDQSGNKVQTVPIKPVIYATEASIGMAF